MTPDRETITPAEKTMKPDEQTMTIEEPTPTKTMLTRRDFLVGLGGAAAGGAVMTIVAPPLFGSFADDGTQDNGGDGSDGTEGTDGTDVVGFLDSYPEVKIGSLASLSSGIPVAFDYPFEGDTNLLVKIGKEAQGGIGPDGDVVAFSDVCTHMGCGLSGLYKADHGVLGPCSCHLTTFDLTKNGYVTIGQATQSLPQVTLRLDGDDIYATGILGLLYGRSDNLGNVEV